MASVWAELKRRNVVKVAVAYAIVGWVLIEISSTVFPIVMLPEWTVTFVTMLLFLGFPVALVLSWAYELTPDGLKPTYEVVQSESITQITGRKLDFIIIGLMALAIVYLVLNYVLVDEHRTATIELEPEITADALMPLLPIVEDAQRDVLPNSVAVLPFENLSLDPENAFFAAGIHDEILNQLAKVSSLNVIARTSVMQYAGTEKTISEIANELNVQTVIEGSVRYANDRVLVTAQLIDPVTNAHLWSESYNRELSDVFAIQADIAMNVANAMETTLSEDEIAIISRPPTESAEAYTLFLETRYQQDAEDAFMSLDDDGWIMAGIKRLERAVELDPLFARGFAELGFLVVLRATNGPFEIEQELFDQSVDYANMAIELDPNVGRAYQVLQIVSFERRQWDEWDGYARKALEFPDRYGRAAYNYAGDLIFISQFANAYHWLDVAISKEPSLVVFRESSAEARIQGRDYGTALTKIEEFRALGGDKNAYHVMRAYTLYRLGRRSDVIDELSQITPDPMIIISRAIYGYHDYLRCQLGWQSSVLEELQRVESESLRELKIRYCAAGVGDLDTVFESFQRTMQTGRNIYYATGVFDDASKDPRWQAVVDYMSWPTVVSQIK